MEEAILVDILTPDLCVIGAGSGGLAVAEAARAHGASVVLVERDRLGGNNLNTGTIPAKALGAAAANTRAIRTASAFGIGAEEPKVNFRKLHDHLEQTVLNLAPQSAAPRYQALGAEIVKGEARFIDKRTLAAGDVQIRAHRFVIATGGRPVVPTIMGLDAVPFFTTETIFDNTRKLTHLAIIGAGRLGLELGQAYARLGTQVTVIDNGTPLAGTDPDLAYLALRRLEEEGVAIRANTNVLTIHGRSMGIGVVIRAAEDEEVLDVSHILVAAGRLPNIHNLDLDKAGIRRLKLDADRLQLSPSLRTSNRRVYAIGDAAGGAPSAQAARYQARLVVRSALFGLQARQEPHLVPVVTYTDPEIAEIGLNEAMARDQLGDRFRVTRWSFADNDAARAARQTFGAAKLITDRAGRILGAGIVGERAGELIALFSFAIANKLSTRHLGRFVASYPSFSEIAGRLGDAAGHSVPPSPLLKQWMTLVRLFG